MSAVLDMLKGGLSLEDALQARVDRIVANGERSSGYSMSTTKQDGYSQAILYPAYAENLLAVSRALKDRAAAEAAR